MNGYFDIPSDTRLAGPEPSKRTVKWDEHLDNCKAAIWDAEKTYRDDLRKERELRRAHLQRAAEELAKAIEALA